MTTNNASKATETMTNYYAVYNVNGPISVKLDATSIEEARAEFEAADTRSWIDGCRTDAEDDLDICGEGMSEEEFAEALQAAGAELVADLARGALLWTTCRLTTTDASAIDERPER